MTSEKDEGLIKDRYESILKEFQTILTVCYLFMIGIGMIFTYHKYKVFGINILDYADIVDYLIAPFGNIYILFYTTIAILAPYLLYKMDVIISKSFPRLYRFSSFGMDQYDWYGTMRGVMVFCGMLVYLWLGSNFYSLNEKQRIFNCDPIQVEYMDNTITSGKMIGQTTEFLFLLIDDNKVHAIPTSSVVKHITLTEDIKPPHDY